RARPKARPLLSKISKARRATESCSPCTRSKRSAAGTSFSGVREVDFVGCLLDAWSTIVLRSFPLGEVFVWLSGLLGCSSEGSTSLRDRRAATSILCLLRRLTFPAVSAEED